MTPIADHPHTNPKHERGPETSPKRQQGSATTTASQPNPIGSLAEIAEPSGTNESRIMRALQEYRTAREAGANPDRHEFLARHADIATELSQCLEALDFVYQAAPRFQDSALEPAGLLQTSEVFKASEVSAEAQPPLPLGDYQIIREIGRGGMGVVYEAIQLSLGRRVALKVLPFAAALDAKQLQRFKNEAQAAAHLQHQNIVPVYFVGCERGVHFYAMQFVEGQTLAALIQELRQSLSEGRLPPEPESQRGSKIEDRGSKKALGAGLLTPPKGPTVGLLESTRSYGREENKGTRLGDRESVQKEANATIENQAADAETLPAHPRSSILDSPSSFFRTVANLGIQAAEALEHAHQLGVIHRDIKPGNMMVDARGNLWITDFGLVHCQGACELTMSGDLLGTLRYMSPEQALAQRVLVDQRTDIYSLGVTLYELLTLEPAFPGTDRQELLRQIAFEEPKPPRRLNKAIPAEMETILLKAMEKNPADRYVTAQNLADDLERYLKHEPIRARRPTLRQRAAKWMRRHPGVTIAVGTSAVLLLVLVASGLAVNTYLIGREQEQTKKAYESADEAYKQSQRNLALALETLDKIYLQLAEQRLPKDPQRQQEDQRLLQDAVAFYERFAEENRSDPTVRHEVGGAYRRVGGIWQLLGRHDKAKEAWTRWGEVVEQLANEFPGESIYRAELAGSYYNVGTLLAAEGDRTAAAQHYQSASHIWDKLTQDFPEDPMYRRCVACAHSALGGLLGQGGEWRAAAEHHRRAVDLMRQVVKERPKALKYCWELAKDQNYLAMALEEQGKWAAAKKQYQTCHRNPDSGGRRLPRRPPKPAGTEIQQSPR